MYTITIRASHSFLRKSIETLKGLRDSSIWTSMQRYPNVVWFKSLPRESRRHHISIKQIDTELIFKLKPINGFAPLAHSLSNTDVPFRCIRDTSFATHIATLFSHLYVQQGHPPLINFYWTNILSETQLKKFTVRTLWFLPFFLPFTSLPLQSPTAVTAAATAAPAHCSRSEPTRGMHRAVTRFASYWPLAVASVARDAFTHTGVHRAIPSYTPRQRAYEVSPPDGANAFSQLDVRIRSAHLWLRGKLAFRRLSIEHHEFPRSIKCVI
jgi:hypothetical protein